MSPRLASPVCYLEEPAVDPVQERDVARWRRAERTRLLTERRAPSVAVREAAGASLADHLRTLLQGRFDGATGMVLSGYWPIKAEPDLRPVLSELHASGVIIALPVVEQKAAPLVFRLWTPETRMVRGDWNIPVPPADAPQLMPQIALAPLVGWTAEGFRLGYGGGYFDRTLAALTPRAFTIGIGFLQAQLPTIYPQPHDIRLDVILTEAGNRTPVTVLSEEPRIWPGDSRG